MRIVIFGLSITSSWGNGHATTYRALVRELCGRGHDVLFLERDRPWYAANRDLPRPPYGRFALYSAFEELRDRFQGEVAEADVVIVGSYVSEGVSIGRWVQSVARGLTAFYDIDTPVTLAKLERGEHHYLSPDLIPGYDLYLSFTGGPVLRTIETRYGSPCVRPLYCSVDVDAYYPDPHPKRWDLGYLGTYSADRQAALKELLIAPSLAWPEGRFVVAGSRYPAEVRWNGNIDKIDHLAPGEHRRFFNSQRFTLNVTRGTAARVGYSPNARLFEAAACGTAVISDYWPGLDTFFEPGKELLVAQTTSAVLDHLRALPEREREELGRRARERVLREHTSERRAAELEDHIRSALNVRSRTRFLGMNRKRRQEHRSAG